MTNSSTVVTEATVAYWLTREWDADAVLERNIDLETYRQVFPYPYYHFLPAMHNLNDREAWVPPLHFFGYALLFALCFAVLKFVLYRAVFLPLARALGLLKDDYDLFAESGLQAVFYIGSWSACAVLVMNEDWFWNPMEVFEGNFPNQPMSDNYYWLLVMYAGWYSFGMFTHVFVDVRRKDFWEMFVHHAVTLALLYVVITKGYYRFMALTTYTHDVCDIFLHFAKMGKYWDNVHPTSNIVQIPCFLPVPLSWLIFRLWLFPRLVMYTSIVQCPELVGIDNCSYYWVYTPLLVTLLLLQVFWFYLVLRVGWRKATGSTFADIREGQDRSMATHKGAKTKQT